MHTFLLLTFVFATLLQLLYWLFLFQKLAAYDTGEEEKQFGQFSDYPVTIIICAQNEAKNLFEKLPRILNQTDRSTNLLVVNDNSYDKSLYILNEFQNIYPTFAIKNLTYVKSLHIGKKYALSVGIETADREILLLTDADCVPASENWAKRMKAGLNGRAIGLGYSPYERRPGFLNLFIRYEAVWTAIQYLSLALAGQPYMGVGRNLIYKKELYTRAGGFDRHKDLASGDDDLFINAVAEKENTAVILHPESFMYSEPKTTWRAYFRQKKRHLSTATRYRLRYKILLGAYSGSHFLHYTVGFTLLYYNDITIFFTLFAVRMLVVLWQFRRIVKRLQDPEMWVFVPVLDLAYLLFYLFFAPALMNTNNTWK